MKRILGLAAVAALAPGLALAGQVTLVNATGAPIEIRAVRAGVVKQADGEVKTFLYQAEDGDFRVWTAGDRCNHIFFFEASEDAALQVTAGPVLYRLPADAKAAVDTPALKASQPQGWPMTPSAKECD